MSVKSVFAAIALNLSFLAHSCMTIGCPNGSDDAVLDKVIESIGRPPSWLDDPSDADFSAWQLKNDRLRVWASAIRDRCTKYEYLSWLDYFQDDAWGYEKETAEEMRAKATISPKIPAPEPSP